MLVLSYEEVDILPEFGSGQHAYCNDVQYHNRNKMEFQGEGVAVEGVINDRYIRSRDQNANSDIIDRLKNVVHLLTNAQEIVEDCASRKTENGTDRKNDNRPTRD